MTELSFLLDLLLNEKLSLSVKKKITERVKEVESAYARPLIQAPSMFVQNGPIPPGAMQNQAPSTVAALQRHAAEPAPPIIASPVVNDALQKRDQAINQAMSGKPEPGRTSPRKF